MTESLQEILAAVGDPHDGLPEDVFEFAASVVPMVNVDLLIRDTQERILLAWREDKFSGGVWHIPGGIVRFKETLLHRVDQVAITEIGQQVQVNPDPLAINEIMTPHQERGHFISLLYECWLTEELQIMEKMVWEPGDLKWFSECPPDFIPCQVEAYQRYFKSEVSVV